MEDVSYTFMSTCGVEYNITCTLDKANETLVELRERYTYCSNDPWLANTAKDCLSEIEAIEEVLNIFHYNGC